MQLEYDTGLPLIRMSPSKQRDLMMAPHHLEPFCHRCRCLQAVDIVCRHGVVYHVSAVIDAGAVGSGAAHGCDHHAQSRSGLHDGYWLDLCADGHVRFLYTVQGVAVMLYAATQQ